VPQPESRQQREDRSVNQRLAQIGFHQPQKMHDTAHADEINQAVQSLPAPRTQAPDHRIRGSNGEA
jgi:hypothetical protein